MVNSASFRNHENFTGFKPLNRHSDNFCLNNIEYNTITRVSPALLYCKTQLSSLSLSTEKRQLMDRMHLTMQWFSSTYQHWTRRVCPGTWQSSAPAHTERCTGTLYTARSRSAAAAWRSWAAASSPWGQRSSASSSSRPRTSAPQFLHQFFLLKVGVSVKTCIKRSVHLTNLVNTNLHRCQNGWTLPGTASRYGPRRRSILWCLGWDSGPGCSAPGPCHCTTDTRHGSALHYCEALGRGKYTSDI